MQIVENTADRLVILSRSTYVLAVGAVILAVLALQWWVMPGFGRLSTLVFGIGAAVMVLIMLGASGSARLVADRRAGQVTLERRRLFGRGSQVVPLGHLQGAAVTSRKPSGSARAYRCEVLVAGQAAWPLTSFFGPAGPAERAAAAINAWVAAS